METLSLSFLSGVLQFYKPIEVEFPSARLTEAKMNTGFCQAERNGIGLPNRGKSWDTLLSSYP
jgi:hypothetical protein